MDTVWLTIIKGKQVCDPYANRFMSRMSGFIFRGYFVKMNYMSPRNVVA
jgi:hypothetical protein